MDWIIQSVDGYHNSTTVVLSEVFVYVLLLTKVAAPVIDAEHELRLMVLVNSEADIILIVLVATIQ